MDLFEEIRVKVLEQKGVLNAPTADTDSGDDADGDSGDADEIGS